MRRNEKLFFKTEHKSTMEEIANELHKPARKNYPRRKFITKGIDDLWQADLVEMDTGSIKGISKINNGYKYMLTVIDVFSKYAWAIPIKNKTSSSTVEAFERLLVSRKPDNLQTHNGKELYNKDFKKLMSDNCINHYSTFSDKKAAVVERFNRTLKEKMWKLFTIQGNYNWIKILDDLLVEYNNTKHRTIGIKPNEVNKYNESTIKIYVSTPPSTAKTKHLKSGDPVRISKAKSIFEKGYTPNWSTEVFTISEVLNTEPVTYHLKDYKEEYIKGIFYEQELSKTKYPETYLVEKVLKKKGDKVYVKWRGFDNSHNSWIDHDNV